MSSIEKTFTNDENYQKIVNLYGADFVEKYYSVFNKVYGLIDISDYNIDDVQKNKLFSNAIKKYIAINKYLAFKNWNDVKLMFDFITVDDLPEMKMVQESNISINEIIAKYGIDGLISSGIDIDCLFMGKKILELDELNKIKGIEIDDLKKFVYSNDRKILDVCTVDKLLNYGIKNFIELTQLHNLYLINDMIKVIPLNLIRMGANTELKREFIKKYGMDNIIRLDEETGGMFSHQYDENNIYSVQNDLLKAVSTFFERDFSIKYERNLNNLILFSPKLKFLIQSKIHKEHQSWRYKKLLSDQIDVVLEDRNNDLKKINLLALLYEIKETNSQLLKFQKPIIYSMNIHGIFETQTLKILAPIIFKIFDDDVNFQANIEALNITDSNYLSWINRFSEE